jgi:hypothetical protein
LTKRYKLQKDPWLLQKVWYRYISMISCKQVEQLLAYCRLRLHSIGILHWNMDSVIASKLAPQFDQAYPGTKVFDGFYMFLYVFICSNWLLRLPSTQASVLALGSGFLLFELELLETLRRCHVAYLSIV